MTRTRSNGIAAQGVEPYLRSRVAVIGGCWIWQRAVCGGGYPKARDQNRKLVGAHRLAYEHWHGPIPAGRHVIQECRNQLCISPEHLLALTPSEARPYARPRLYPDAKPKTPRIPRTACPKGHPYATTGRSGSGCLECERERMRTPEMRAYRKEKRRLKKLATV